MAGFVLIASVRPKFIVLKREGFLDSAKTKLEA